MVARELALAVVEMEIGSSLCRNTWRGDGIVFQGVCVCTRDVFLRLAQSNQSGPQVRPQWTKGR